MLGKSEQAQAANNPRPEALARRSRQLIVAAVMFLKSVDVYLLAVAQNHSVWQLMPSAQGPNRQLLPLRAG